MIIHGNEIKIFSCNSNIAVAKQIAKILGLPLGDMQVGTFSDGEISITIRESVRGSDVFVVQSTCQPVNKNLMELLISIDAFKRASAGRITAVMPYFGYGRQDRKAKSRDPISAKLVADLIMTAGAHRVLTMDLHADQIQGFFNIPVDHLVGVSLFAKQFLKDFADIPNDKLVVVSPDLGSVTRARKFAEKIDLPLAIIDKRRPKANVSEVVNIIGDVKDKTCILIDDLVDTAGTLCGAANMLVSKGGATEVYAGVTHGVLSGQALKHIEESAIKELYLLDTIPLVSNTASGKIKMLPIAPVFAEAINRIYTDRSISPLMS